MKRRHWLPFLTLAVLCCGTAHAGDPAKKALKGLRAAAKDEVAALHASLKDDRFVLFAALDAVDAVVAVGAGSTAEAQDLFDELMAYQASSREGLTAALDGFYSKAADLLNAYQASHPGEQPRGFAFGDEVGLDEFTADVRAELTKSLASVHKRAAKTVKALEKKAGLTALVRIQPPPVPEYRFAASTPGDDGGYVEPTIDVLVTVSDPAVANDGIIHLGGSAVDTTSVMVGFQFFNGGGFGPANPLPGDRWEKRYLDRAEVNHIITLWDFDCPEIRVKEAIGVR